MENRFHLLHYSKIVRNQKGLTIMELMVAVGIVIVVIMGNMIFINDFVKRISGFEKSSMEESELAVLNVMALNVLKKSSLSFNRIYLKEDSGSNFFDYYPDMPLGSFANESRSYTIQQSATPKYFYVISSEEGMHDSTVFDPKHAYRVSQMPADMISDGTVSYSGLNSVPEITDDAGNAATYKTMSKIFGKRWANGEVFVVSCPTYLRPKSSNATVNLSIAPRMPTFIGKVFGDDLPLLTNSEVGVALLNTHPVSTTAYANLNQFFMSLPTMGGAAAFVKVEPALINRFSLQPNANTPGYSDLILQKWTQAGYQDDISVAQMVTSVTFRRKSIVLPIISMEIQK